ncbi:pyridoxamine 5'-phosphate oxidase family protein [Roseibium aggregatum]|uniref:pyridoxamine 5'-phosphate oxidase family protein n=1 Tax=Roseibium aggregatum TaxID=187304 RepID=UPI001AD8E89F|nr:pyridoxamine 5'-phosphate oxidase family protein [Roseibium aggregatum]
MPEDPTTLSDFNDPITTVDQLEAHAGTAPEKVRVKEIKALDSLCRQFIARSPFCLIATVDPEGVIDVSPKGDPAGFVTVLSDTVLAIPDRPGNRRLDSYHNLLKDPRVGLIFLIPGKGETLRVSGRARIVRDAWLLERMQVEGKQPAMALAVEITRAFMHCPKAMVRSKIWQPESWRNADDLGDIGDAMIRHGKLKQTPEALLEEATSEGLLRLY